MKTSIFTVFILNSRHLDDAKALGFSDTQQAHAWVHYVTILTPLTSCLYPDGGGVPGGSLPLIVVLILADDEEERDMQIFVRVWSLDWLAG